MPDPIKAPEAPAVPAFIPKVGSYATLAETDEKKGVTTTYLFLVTEVGTEEQVKRDAKGNVITTDKSFDVGNGQNVIRRVAVSETIPSYNGFAFNAQQAVPSPRRKVLLTALSPLS